MSVKGLVMKAFDSFGEMFGSQTGFVSVFNTVQEKVGEFDIVTSPSLDGVLSQVYYDDLESNDSVSSAEAFFERVNRSVYWSNNVSWVANVHPALRDYNGLIADIVEWYCSGIGLSFGTDSGYDGCFRCWGKDRGLTREEAKQLAAEINNALKEAGRVE